ncbi:MAG: AtpZ/AtpI family protein [Acholeplasmatales bacterium]|nr:AtpZ/AtpI family protein [Acholeplasmatales bacterium]
MKLGKYAKIYALGTQGIFSMAIFSVIGFFIGYYIDKDSFWPVTLAIVGLILGFFNLMISLLYLAKMADKERKKSDES